MSLQQHDFNLFAKRCKESGLSTKQALDKFVKAMMQGPKLKIVKKKPIRSYENGIKIFADGRERCMTKEAWNTRRDEVFNRDEITDAAGGWYCEACGEGSEYRQDFDVDHIIKRSIMRDDRLRNLQLLGNRTLCNCHGKKHDSFKKRGARA